MVSANGLPRNCPWDGAVCAEWSGGYWLGILRRGDIAQLSVETRWLAMRSSYRVFGTPSCSLGCTCGSTGKESACNEGDLGLIPRLGRSPGEGKGYPLVFWPGEFIAGRFFTNWAIREAWGSLPAKYFHELTLRQMTVVALSGGWVMWL